MAEHGSGITAVERARRQKVVDRARHSTEMEGGSVSAQAQANLDRYVAGEIDSEQLEAARFERDATAQVGG